MNKTVILVAGPTAVGKTATAIRIAQMLGTDIISADSRQCYREISIGTAKPSAEELAAVRHYFIDSHSIATEVNAAMYEELAMGYAAEVFSRHNTVVLTGGTGLYIRAFLEGMDDMPPYLRISAKPSAQVSPAMAWPGCRRSSGKRPRILCGRRDPEPSPPRACAGDLRNHRAIHYRLPD